MSSNNDAPTTTTKKRKRKNKGDNAPSQIEEQQGMTAAQQYTMQGTMIAMQRRMYEMEQRLSRMESVERACEDAVRDRCIADIVPAVTQRTLLPAPTWTLECGELSDGDESEVEHFQFLEEKETSATLLERGVDARYNILWDDEFRNEIEIDGRGHQEQTNPMMAGIDDPSTMRPCFFYQKFLPMKYIDAGLIPATNRVLVSNSLKPISKGEFLGWLGLWINISLHPGYPPRDFFSLQERSYDWNPPFLGKFMSGKRFEQINSHLTLTTKESPSYLDRFFWVRDLIEAFNSETKDIFIPGWLVVIDKTLVDFPDKSCPGGVVFKRKSHSMGNLYYATACCATNIIFHIEIDEGRDKPKEGPHSESKFEEECGSRVGALATRMTEGIWFSGRAVLLDSELGYVPSVVQLKKKGLFSTAHIKKQTYWPRYTKAEEAVGEMNNRYVGEVRVRKGAYYSGAGSEELYMISLADSKHASLMLSNWGTTARIGTEIIRRVGGELVKFQYTMHQHYFYLGRNGVEENNNERQGFLSFEEAYIPKDWNAKQFFFIAGLAASNAHMAHDHFLNDFLGKEKWSKVQYLRSVMKDLINNNEWEEEKRAAARDESIVLPKTMQLIGDSAGIPVEHRKATIPTKCLRYNGREFPAASHLYQKYNCNNKCGKKVRTYCVCNKMVILCDECYAAHKAEYRNLGCD